MGKGKRTRIAYELEAEIKAAKAAAEKARKKKSQMITIISLAVGFALIAGSIFGTVWYNNASEDGTFLRNKTVFQTENYEIDVCMLQYLFNSAVGVFEDSYSSDLETLKLDTTKPLNEQACYYDEDITWHDYFMESAEKQATEILTLCEAAKEENFELTETDEKFIKESIDTIKESAEDAGQTEREYLTELYGSQVNMEDVEKCIRLTTLASNYYNELSKTFKYSDEQIENRFDNNKESYLSVGYLYLTVYNNATGEESESELKKLNKKAKDEAKKIADAKDSTEFKNNIEDYLRGLCEEYYTDYSEEEIDEQVKTLMDSVSGTAKYDVSNDLGKWLFDSKRKTNDINIFQNEEGTGYDIFCITQPAVKDTSATQNVRHILLDINDYDSAEDCNKAANKLLKSWKNGNKTVESFAALAKKYSTDQGSANNGGLYENVPEGKMVTEFNDWIFDKKREIGDTDVVDTTYGSHIMYYCGEGLASWQINVVSDMKDEDYSKKLEKLKEKYELEINKDYYELVKFIEKEEETEETTSSVASY